MQLTRIIMCYRMNDKNSLAGYRPFSYFFVENLATFVYLVEIWVPQDGCLEYSCDV